MWITLTVLLFNTVWNKNQNLTLLKIIYQTLQLSNLKLYGMSLNIPSTTSDQSASSVVQAAQQLSTAVTDQNLCSVQKPASIPMYLLNAHSWSDAGRMKTCDRYSPNLLDLCILCYVCNDSPSYSSSEKGQKSCRSYQNIKPKGYLVS